MSGLGSIETMLQIAARRQRWQSAWRGFWRGTLVGGGILLVGIGLYKIFPLPEWTLLLSGGLALLVMAAGFVAGFARQPSLVEMARWLDREKQLQERLSTALEISQTTTPGHWRDLVLLDATRHVQGLDPRQLLPFHLPMAARWALLVLALTAGLGLVPEYRSASYLERQQDARNIREAGRRLAELNKRTLEARPPALEQTQKAMEAVGDLSALLSKAPLTRAEALKEVSQLSDKIQKLEKQVTDQPGIKRLERAAREPGGSTTSGTQPGDQQKKMEQLQKGLGKAADKMDQMEKMKQGLEQAKKAAEGMPAKDTPAGAVAREQLAQALADLAQQAKDMGQPLAGLEEAIAALQADKSEMFMKDLNLAMEDLDKLQKMAKALQQMQQQAGNKLGKDLAEQLQNGQAQAAIGTLNKMMQQLQAGQLTPEQVKQILAEVQKAMPSAEEYGKVAEHLAKAAECLKQGQCPNGAKSLGEAAKELQKLLDQMGDAQSLAATLDALEKAGMCMSDCQGTCQGRGQGRPKFGQGGKPGGGVGTWAEETGWLAYPSERGALMDNSGVQRPDMDSRGHTDRDQNRPDNLEKTKVRGQIAPGSSMPSVTLKGVSIKGTSTVQYEDAVRSAQSAAQSALNQDEVPRAYRGAVKDYFDDLKK
ncbi:MAG: hypothetical protein WCO56_21560 [Verrucomicrobiota bacterium]